MCTFPNLSLFVLISLLPFFLPICSYYHSILLSLTLSLSLLLSSLCFSLLGSILTPLNARALINQCRVALFHRDPKQLVSFPVCLCLPVCCRCTSVCLFTWHACLHAMSFAELCESDKYVGVRKVWRMLHGGFVPNQFATLHASRNMQKKYIRYDPLYFAQVNIGLVSYIDLIAGSSSYRTERSKYACSSFC